MRVRDIKEVLRQLEAMGYGTVEELEQRLVQIQIDALLHDPAFLDRVRKKEWQTT